MKSVAIEISGYQRFREGMSIYYVRDELVNRFPTSQGRSLQKMHAADIVISNGVKIKDVTCKFSLSNAKK